MTKEETYDERIYPLMAQIIEICKQAKINVAAQFSLNTATGNEDLWCTTVLADADPDDKEGHEQMCKLYRTMKPPGIIAFTVTTSSK